MTDGEAMKEIPPIPIPFRINFVIQSMTGWEDVAEAQDCPDPDTMPERIRRTEEIHVAQSYMHLRRRGHDVRLTEKFVPDEVCVAVGALRTSRFPFRSFTVAIQYHLLVAKLCHCNFVQNELLLRRPNEFFMPLWPQPGILPRHPSRGSRLERIAYLGDESLSEAFTGQRFQRQLAEMGITLVTPRSWNDYSEIDAILAVRNVPPSYLACKPASKLVNAWTAGVPALLGPEPAFIALRKSDLDFIEVREPQDAEAGLRRLKADPALYDTMVRNGRTRAADFSVNVLARRWERLFSGPIAERYRNWLAGPRGWREARNLSAAVWRVALHRSAVRAVDRYNRQLIQNGHDWRRTEPVPV